MILLLVLVHLSSTAQIISSNNEIDMAAEIKTVDVRAIAQYRGPLLGNHWIEESNNSFRHDREAKICNALFLDALKTKNVTWPPPKSGAIKDIKDLFIMGKAHFAERYLMDQQNGGKGYNWNSAVIKTHMAQPNICGGYYNDVLCAATMEKYDNLIRDKVGAVIGSLTPWAEAALFNHGAKKVLTIEYMSIKTDYPSLFTYHPSKVAELYLNENWEPVDLIFSYSSLEHDGLGRYGDPINPFGDLESVGRARCLLKEKGILMIGIPVGLDSVVWNAHRIYGKYRLALLSLGFRLLDIMGAHCIKNHFESRGDCQPIFILEKKH